MKPLQTEVVTQHLLFCWVHLTRLSLKKSCKVSTLTFFVFFFLLLFGEATWRRSLSDLASQPLPIASSLHLFSMHWLAKVGLGKTHRVRGVLVHVAKFVSGRDMSSSQPPKPVTLLGSMAFGGRANAQQSLDMVTAFLDRGHKQVDTAFMYMDGKSETIIGGMNLPETGSSTGRCRC